MPFVHALGLSAVHGCFQKAAPTRYHREKDSSMHNRQPCLPHPAKCFKLVLRTSTLGAWLAMHARKYYSFRFPERPNDAQNRNGQDRNGRTGQDLSRRNGRRNYVSPLTVLVSLDLVSDSSLFSTGMLFPPSCPAVCAISYPCQRLQRFCQVMANWCMLVSRSRGMTGISGDTRCIR